MSDGQKTQLTLTRCYVRPEGTLAVDSSKTFTAMVNPAELTHTRSIAYNKKKTLGQVGSDAKFSAIEPDRLRFSITLDGTGVVPTSSPGGTVKDVKTHLADLNQVVYTYVSDKHEPSHVRVLWGTLLFFGRMEGMSVRYTLFKPSGDPLRAKVDMNFVGTMSRKESELVANQSSPDLSHTVIAVAGDTLPLLCDRIYGDPSYYVEVARFNALAGFRSLQPGQRLHFPPLG